MNMTEQTEDTSIQLSIAETYLKEMLKADDTKDFALYIKRYEKERIAGFSQERFHKDIECMHQDNGLNLSYEFLSTLRPQMVEGVEVFRTVWKGIYEKRDAVIELGIYQKGEDWFVIRSAVY